MACSSSKTLFVRLQNLMSAVHGVNVQVLRAAGCTTSCYTLRPEALAMRVNRLFFAQEAVDGWLEAGRVTLEGDVLSLPAGPTFRLLSAVVFQAEVGSGVDAFSLCGKVKSHPELEAMSGELATGSVLIGDSAYEVVDGFLAELLDAAESGEALRAVQQLAGEG
jgi:hypothetical protein